VLTQPADLSEDAIAAALTARWDLRVVALSYQAVGFGSHHWLATGAGGDQLFVTVDDLRDRQRGPDDSLDTAFAGLARAFGSALSLRRDAGLEFVLAPRPAADGAVVHRLTDRYSLVVHPYLADCEPGHDDGFRSSTDRQAVLDLVIAVHGASATPPPVCDFALPGEADLIAALRSTGETWNRGPYGPPARDLLARHAAGLTVIMQAYRELAGRVRARPERQVITHGEPSSGNVLRTPAGWVIVDWESALLAPPERDLWALAEEDPAILAAYCAGTGTEVDRDSLALHRLWYDLAEISAYLRLFREDHEQTEDCAESWQNLEYFLRPADRWPGLLPPGAKAS
jgi:hypothetical protein